MIIPFLMFQLKGFLKMLRSFGGRRGIGRGESERNKFTHEKIKFCERISDIEEDY